MFYTNGNATLYTELEIVDKDFSVIQEKEYTSIIKGIETEIDAQTHAVKK